MLNKIINPSTPGELLFSRCLANPIYRPNASSKVRKIGYIGALLTSGLIYYYMWEINKLEHEVAHHERMAEYFKRQFNSTERDYMLMKDYCQSAEDRAEALTHDNELLCDALGSATNPQEG